MPMIPRAADRYRRSLLFSLSFSCAVTNPDATDCFNDMSQDGAVCDDRDPTTAVDVCYQGACGSWVTIDATILSEADRRAWAQADPFISSAYSANCYECADRVLPDGPPGADPAGTYPKYLALEAEGDNGHHHGQAATNMVIHSYVSYKQPDMHFSAWRISDAGKMGDMHGRALFVDRAQGCDPAAPAGVCQNLMIRSENQRYVEGYSSFEVFVPSAKVQISNVRTHSTRQCKSRRDSS